MKETTVYALLDPRNNEARYVGRSENPYYRLCAHRSTARSNPDHPAPVYQWITSLAKEGLAPEMVALEEYDAHDDWTGEAEKFWILYMMSLGARLLNRAVVFDGWNSPPPPRIPQVLRLDRDSYFLLKRLKEETGICESEIVAQALKQYDQTDTWQCAV